MTIRYLSRKTVKQRLWKTLNLFVGVTTILNVSMVGALIKPLVAQATGPTWPTDGQWIIPVCNDDVANDENPDSVDLKAAGAEYGAAYYIANDTLYLRERVNGNPGGGSTGDNWDQYAWVFMIQKDAATTDYDYLISLRGSGQGENIELWENTAKNGPIDWSPIFNDPADTQLQTWPTTSLSRATATGTDYFVDWQVPLSVLTSRGVVVNNGKFGTNQGLFWATSTNANNYNKDHLNCYDAPDLRISKEVSKNGGSFFDDGRQDGVTAAPGDTLKYRVTVTNVGGPTTGSSTVTDELGKNFNDGDGDASHNINPSTQYSAWTATKNLNSDGNANPFTGTWGDGSADGQTNDTLALTIPLVSGGGAQEQFTFDAIVRNDLAVGSYLFENVATVGSQNAETDVPVVRVGQCVLEITKAVNKQTALPGEQLTYTLTYTNSGNANCTGGGVRIDDVTPPNTTYVNGSNTQTNSEGDAVHFGYAEGGLFGPDNAAGYNPATKLLSWDAETVVPGETGTITYKVTVNSLPICTTTNIDNTAKAYADQVPSGVTSNQVRTVVTTPCNGNLQVNKEFDDNGDGQVDRTNPQGWTWDVVNGSQDNAGGASLPLAQAAYTVTEDPIADYSSAWSCSNQTSGNGTSFNANVVANQTLTCTFRNTRDTGTITVTKKLDADGNGSFETVNPNGWTWTLDAGNDRAMGSSATLVPTGSHDIDENNVASYHFVGWYPTGSTQYSCTNPQGTSRPINVSVSKGQTTSITLCNARDTGSLTVNKEFDDNGDGQVDRTNPQGWTWDVVNGSQDNAGGATLSLTTNNYTVTEDAIVGYSSSWTCSNDTNGLGVSMPVSITTGQQVTCTYRNTRDLGTLIVHKNVINPDGGEVADLHAFTVTVSGQSNGTIAEGTDAIYSNIPTGPYTVTELPDGSYTFVSYSTDNDAAPGAQVVVSKNATTHLTVTNKQKKVEIVVHKNVVAYDGQTDVVDNQSFTADVNGATGAISESQTFSTFVNPGWVTVGEPNVPTNYVLVGIAPSNFQVASGDQAVHVTITNKQKPSSITGSKFNDLNGNGTWDQGEPGLANWTICINEENDTDQPTCTTTDINGAYSFGPLIPGDYHVWELQQNGWMQTAPQGNLYDVTVGPNETAANKDFGNFKLGKISGYKFNDLNGNGTWDQGEPGLANWTIQLSGAAAAADVTDANGYYEFTGLLYGTYTVQEVQQIGWLQTSTNPADINVISGTDSQGNNFGNFALGSISGRKFDDLNGNGTWDQGEPTIAGWTIYLNDGDNLTSTQTDANGIYAFSNLGPDSYTVSENLVTGWIQTFPPQNGTYLVTLTSGANVTDKDFGNFQLGKISGYKFNDLNGNGAWNQGEPGIAGWGMTLSNGQQNWNMVTDGTGYYEFAGLMVGTYGVTEENRSGWTPTTPSSINDIAVTSGVNSQANTFGNFQLVSLNGSKFNDLNGNGTWDNGEPGLANWTINLDQGANGSVDATTVTDGNGNYSFANLGPGTYRLREVQQAGWTQTSANPADVTVVSGTNVNDLDFGNFALGQISGYKFNDLNGNGTWDQGEPTIQGWTIQLWANGNQIDSTQTDANGLYTFGGLVADTYSVAEQAAAGWTQTTVNPAPIVMTSGLNSQNNTFGNFQLVSLNGSKFNDLNGNGTWDQGEPGLTGWTINLDQDANGSVDASTVTDANGNYSFANLGPGTYRLREVQQAGWTQTSANPADVTVVSGTNVNDLDFGNFQYGRIEGYKLNEQEQGLANWTICLDNGDDLQCTQTDDNGHYAFDQLPYGTYTVSEVLPYGWTQLSPLDPNTYSVLVTSGVGQNEGHASYNFVNQRNAFEVDLDKIAPETVNAGDQMTYTINWAVTGNTPVSNLIVTDNLPSNVSFVSASNGGSYDTTLNRVTWDLGTKIPTDNGSLTVTVNVATPLAKGTTLENYAQICGQGELVLDGEQQEGPTTKCDDDTTTTTVNSDVNVTLVKTDSVDPVAAGAQLTYTLAWTVSGNAPIDNLVINDPLPANTTFVSATNGGAFALGTITWNLGAQTPGANGSVSFTVTVASPIVNGTVLTNTAEACVDSFTRTQEEVLHRCDSDDETTVVTSAPLLSIVKSSNITTFVNPGSTAQYTVTITNATAATDTARNVVMTDTLPAGFTFAVDGTTTKSFAIGNLAPGQSATVTYIVNISGTQAAGTYNNLAKAKGDNTNEVSATTPIEVRVPQVFGLATTPDLTIVKTAGAKNAKPGDVVTYTLTVKNVGDGDAENVIITDTLPKDLSFVHATGRTMTWNIGTLKAGHTRIINVDVRVESDAKSGTYTNVATVRSDEVPEKSATADLTVKRPVVLGLATTGVGMLDYAIGLAGAGLIALGILGLRRKPKTGELE